MEFGDDDASDTASNRSGISSRHSPSQKDSGVSGQQRLRMMPAPAAPRLRLKVMDEHEGSEAASQDLNGMDNETMSVLSGGSPRFDLPFTFKVKDPNGSLHKVTASAERCSPLVRILSERLRCKPEHLRLTYKDEDGDDIAVINDASLSEAVDAARSNGDNFARLRAEIDESGLPERQAAPRSPAGDSFLRAVDAVSTPVAEVPSAPSSPQRGGSKADGAEQPEATTDSAAASNGSDSASSAPRAGTSPIVLGACALLAAIAVAGIVISRKN